jgi:zinc protease
MRQVMKWIMLIFGIMLSSVVLADDVKSYALPNGLKLFVKEDHRAPVVVSQVWYKVGSSYEYGGITGISHALEHMMFKGTKKYGAGQLARLVAENGGQENAFTDYDFTAYYQMFDSRKLPISFQIESDRMRNLNLDPKEFQKEIQVVMEERRMRIEDNPQQRVVERFLATLYMSNPYHHPLIGWMSDLQSMNINDLKQWYQKWYAPNNAVVVVVGDVKADEVYQLAKRYFGSLKASPSQEIKPQKEVNSLGLRELTVKVPAQNPWFVMGYNVPSIKTAKQAWTPYALATLNAILSSGDSSRLSKNLVRGQQIAADVSSGYDPFSRLSSAFIIESTPAPGHTTADLKAAILDQIKQLQTTPVTPEELARIKAQVIAGNVYKKDSVYEQAYEIGRLESVGLPWKLSDDFVKNIEAVTPEQIQAVAQKYLIEDRMAIAELQPLPLPKNAAPQVMPPQGGDQHVR